MYYKKDILTGIFIFLVVVILSYLYLDSLCPSGNIKLLNCCANTEYVCNSDKDYSIKLYHLILVIIFTAVFAIYILLLDLLIDKPKNAQ